MDILNSFKVNELDIQLPSGKKIRIRERNGEDEEIISKVKNTDDGSSLNKFLTNLVVWDDEKNGKPTEADIIQWKLADKYVALVKERIFSLGAEMVFEYEFKNGAKAQFEEDLSKYDWDFAKGNPPAKGEPGYLETYPKAYPNGKEKVRIFTTSSGKTIEYDYMTGVGEKRALDIDPKELTSAHTLLLRNIKLRSGSESVPLHSTKVFSAKDLSEIRTDILKNDPQFELITRLEGPKGVVEYITLLSVGAFFTPVVI